MGIYKGRTTQAILGLSLAVALQAHAQTPYAREDGCLYPRRANDGDCIEEHGMELPQITVSTGVGRKVTRAHLSGIMTEERNRHLSLEDKGWRWKARHVGHKASRLGAMACGRHFVSF